jgi:hypothetical protein
MAAVYWANAAKMRTRLFIDNAWADASDGRTFATVNPATEETIADVALASAADVDRAVQSSARAMCGEWRRFAPEKRGQLLNRLADLIDTHKDAIARLETLDMGKPLDDARRKAGPGAQFAQKQRGKRCIRGRLEDDVRESCANVTRSSRTCRYYAGAVDKLMGDQIPRWSRRQGPSADCGTHWQRDSSTA